MFIAVLPQDLLSLHRVIPWEGLKGGWKASGLAFQQGQQFAEGFVLCP